MSNTTNIYGSIITAPMKADVLNSQVQNSIFGVKFPLFAGIGTHKGLFNKTKGVSLIRSEALQFIQTERGERVMLPNFGLSLKRFLFEPLTADLSEQVFEEIYTGFAKYLPHIEIQGLRVIPSDQIQGSGLPGLLIQLTVSHKDTNEIANISVNV